MLYFQRLIIVLLFLLPAPSWAWWDCAWTERFTADISKPPGPPLSNFEVRLDLSSTNVPATFDWSNSGSDLRIVDEDDLTELNFFIEQWDSFSQTAIVWVNVPSIPGGGRTVFLYFSGPGGAPNVATPATFSQPGLKFHTRRSTVNPGSRAAAESAWDAANDNAGGYGCAFINDYVDVNNRDLFSPPSRNNEIALFAEVFFEVGPGEAGLWQFRYGADFGRGGGLYVDDATVDEEWNDDLWWAFNWNNTGEILQGSVTLSEGYHSFRILGFEGCCDGGLTAQFQKPGGSWQDMSLANIALVSRQCPIALPTVSYGAGEIGSCPIIDIALNTQAFSDPFNNTTNPKRIPGGVVLIEIQITNSGPGVTDSGSFTITEAIPSGLALQVADFSGATAGPVLFSEGSPASGLSYAFTSLVSATDDVSFSNDNGASYNYSPVAGANGADTNVTHIRITPGNEFQGESGGGNPSATFSFKTVVQ